MHLVQSTKHLPVRRGAITPLVALCMMLMLPAIVALVVDGGMLLTEDTNIPSAEMVTAVGVPA